MEIIILFAIIGIIGSVLKNAAKMQQPPPVVYRKSFQDTMPGPVTLEGTSLESADIRWKKQEESLPESDSYAAPPAGIRDNPVDTFSGSLEESETQQVMSLDSAQKTHHSLDLSENGILNAIILSEVLGPPKALRK